MSSICFITTVFGNYSKFLIPHIRSIKKTHKDCNIKIFYSSIENSTLKLCDECELIKVDVESDSKFGLINERIKYWRKGSEIDSKVALVDVDILFVKNINHFFKKNCITLTFRENHKYEINGGLILLDNGIESKEFMKLYEERTSLIYKNNLKVAREIYGAPDQQALIEIKNKFTINKVSCRDLNEVDCNFDQRTHAFHYKSGWHRYLLDGEPFPTVGPRAACLKAYNYWLLMSNNKTKLI